MDHNGFYVTFFAKRGVGEDFPFLKSDIPQHLVNDKFQYECAVTRVAFVTNTKRCMYMLKCIDVTGNMVINGVSTQIVLVVDTKQRYYAKSYNLPHYFAIGSKPLTQLTFEVLSTDVECLNNHLREMCLTVHVRKLL